MAELPDICGRLSACKNQFLQLGDNRLTRLPDLGIRKLLVVSNGEVSVDSIQFVGLGTTHSERLVQLSPDVREIVLAGDWFDHCAQHQKSRDCCIPIASWHEEHWFPAYSGSLCITATVSDAQNSASLLLHIYPQSFVCPAKL